MKFNFFKTIKLYLLKKLSNAMISVVIVMIRKAYTITPKGKDKNLDLHLRATSVKLLYEVDLEKIEDIKLDKNLLKEIQLKIDTNLELKINVIIHKYCIYIDVVKKIYETIQSLKPPTDEISIYSIDTSHLKITKLISTRMHLMQQYANEKKYFSDLYAYKIDIKYEQIIKFITVSAPILLLGGILKQFILSRIYNFELPIVFTFSDYISSSIDTLIYSIYPLVFLTIGSVWGYHEETRLDYAQKEWGISYQKYMLNLNYVCLIIATIYFYYANSRIFYIFLPLTILMFTLFNLHRITNRYFKNSFSAFSIMFLTINFFTGIFANTMLNSYIIPGKDNQIKYSYIFDNSYIETNNLKIITTGTYYTVFWDYKNLKTVLVKNTKINMIIIDKNILPNK